MPGNKHEGVHVFLVRVRNQDGSVRPGIFIEDMGAKFGCNGVDNGRLKFTDVRVPREHLLNKFSDVSPQGVYSS
jgi:acyl-CoA oxidase